MDRSTNYNNNGQNRDGLLLKTAQHHQSETRSPATTSSPDFVLQWGNRKRLRCMKVQIKDNAAKKFSSSNVPAGPAPVHRATVRIDRRVVRSDHKDPAPTSAGVSNGYPNLRQRQSSPAPPRILRYVSVSDSRAFVECGARSGVEWFAIGVVTNTENSIGMKGHCNGVKGLCSPDRGGGGHDKKGSWLCDLTLERYEVREKKISKKRAFYMRAEYDILRQYFTLQRPRGLKAMGNMESDSE
ncbi:hypothetical protein RJ639_042828 [Escallonia herrerae]|uniref:Uncharacterized protein n=1 Tax=Escallonia herrerae TaxID=1293975 RepID=A0AA88WCG4_9ASTE|nr:hypothetical protein RJ639_042828 [Escallonia herrerae]